MKDRADNLNRLSSKTLLHHLCLNCLETDLVDLVDCNCDVNHLVWETADLCHTCEYLAVVDLHTYVHIEESEHAVNDLHELKLIELRCRADHVNITLIELSVTALLRTVSTPNRLDLESLERECDVVLMLNHETCERHCEVIAKTLLAHLERKRLAVIAILSSLYLIIVVVDL